MRNTQPFHVVGRLSKPIATSTSMKLCVVPEPWLLKRNILAYPSHFGPLVIKSLVQQGNAAIQPDAKWTRFAYVTVKKFGSYDDADKYLLRNEIDESDNDSPYIKQLQMQQEIINDAAKDAEGMFLIPQCQAYASQYSFFTSSFLILCLVCS